MDITDKKIMFGFGSIDKVSQMIGKSNDDNVYFGYDDTSNFGIIVARGKLVSSSILDVYIINNTSTLGKVINVDYMSIDNEIKTLQIPVVDEDDLSDLIESLQSDYAGDNSVTDSSNFICLALKQERGIITYLNVETSDIARKSDLDALAKKLDEHIEHNSDIKGYTVTYNMSNVTSSNTNAEVNEGDNYITVINPSEGYKITEYKVTMGGSDITKIAVRNNIINISNITGNIVITVNTELMTFTIKEDFIDGCTIDSYNNIIGYNQSITLQLTLKENYSLSKENITIYEAGSDKEFIYDSEKKTITINNIKGNIVFSIDCSATYTVTTIFNNVTCTNTATTITDNKEYVNVLNIDESQYKSIQVIVKVNDKDITNLVYDKKTYTITIEKSYGNVIIHAEAVNELYVDLEDQIDLTENVWKFLKLRDISSETFDSDMVTKTYDDSKWLNVRIPHDWSILNSFNSTINGNEYESGWLAGGDAVYRTKFTIYNTYIGNKIYIHFDGIYMLSEIFINGQSVGKNVNGFIPFDFDITDYVVKGENLLAVQVSNHMPSSRSYTGSGIYRKCWISMNNVPSIGTTDIVVKTPNLNSEKGGNVSTDVQFTVQNVTDNDVTLKEVIVNIYQEWDSELVGTSSITQQELSANSSETFNVSVGVMKPELWATHDRSSNTYLYNVQCCLRYTETDNEDYYVYSNKELFGYRYITYDSEGFYLNGEKIFLKGTSNHLDNGILGAETNYSATERKLRLLKDMGCNTLRTTHNTESRVFIECATKMGFLIIEELFDGWRYAKNNNVYDYSRFFSQGDEYIELPIKNTLMRDRNIPSIIMWSIGNEVDTNTNKNLDDTYVSDAEKIISYIKKYDETRPTTIGNNKPADEYAIKIMSKVDIPGINYGSDYDYTTLRNVVSDGVSYSQKSIYGSETTSGFYTRGIYETSVSDNYYTAFDYSNSESSNSHATWGATAALAIKRHMTSLPWLIGMCPWTGFDYIGEPTPANNTLVRSSYFGAIDLVGLPKDVYYLYQSMWTTTPMIHIVPEDWSSYENNEQVTVWIYSNCPTVKLHNNGEEVNVKLTKDNSSHYAYEYEVTYNYGTLVATGYDDENNIIAQDIRYATNNVETKINLYPDKIKVTSDAYIYVVAESTDNYNTVIPTGNMKVKFSVSGGEVVGTDNGFPGCMEDIRNNIQTMFSGKCVAIVKPNGINNIITVSCVSTKNPYIEQSVDIQLSTSNVYTKRTIDFVDPENPPLHESVQDIELSSSLINADNGETVSFTVKKLPENAIDSIVVTSLNKTVTIDVDQETGVVTVYTSSKNIVTELIVQCGFVKKSVTIIFGKADISAPTLYINEEDINVNNIVYTHEYCKYSFEDIGREISTVKSNEESIITVDTTNNVLHCIGDGECDIKVQMLDGNEYTYTLTVQEWQSADGETITTKTINGVFSDKFISQYNYNVNEYIYGKIACHDDGVLKYVIITLPEDTETTTTFESNFGYDKTGKRKAYIVKQEQYKAGYETSSYISVKHLTYGKTYIELYTANEDIIYKYSYTIGTLPCTDIKIDESAISINSDLENNKVIDYTLIPSNTTDEISFDSVNNNVLCRNGAIYAKRSGSDIINIKCGDIEKQVTVNINNITEDDTIICYNIELTAINRMYYSSNEGVEYDVDKTLYIEAKIPDNISGTANVVSFGENINNWSGVHWHIYYPGQTQSSSIGGLGTSETGICIAMGTDINNVGTYGITKTLVGDDNNLIRIVQNKNGIYVNGVNATLIQKTKSQDVFDSIQALTKVYIGTLEGTTGFDGTINEIRILDNTDFVSTYKDGLTEELLLDISLNGFNKYVYMNSWNATMNSLSQVYASDNTYSTILTSGYLTGMQVNTSINVMLVNSHKDNGYILGYNNETLGYSNGFTDYDDVKNKIYDIIESGETTSYMFELIKVNDNQFNIKLLNNYTFKESDNVFNWTKLNVDYNIHDISDMSISKTSLCDQYSDEMCFVIQNSDDKLLNANGSSSMITFNNNKSEWCIWNIFKINI